MTPGAAETPTPSSRRSARLNEVLANYLDAVDAGRAPSHDAWIRAHPDIEAELRDYFAAARELESAVEPLRDATAAPAPVEAGRTFAGYEILDEIGRGGMGVVYRARQTKLKRDVALKMVLRGDLASPEEIQRFRREAEAVAGLDHPNIVRVFDVGEERGIHYYAMQLVAGTTLAERRNELRTSPHAAARLLATIARAIAYAHDHGVLHRDLKPANIIIDANGEPHVGDFGLAKRLGTETGLTRSGEVLGTPSYMAPEQAAGGKQASPGSDVYALGAVLYDVVTGRPPFEGATALDTLRKVTEEEPRRPRSWNESLPQDLETVVLKCLEKEPRRRYASALDLAEELERFLRGEPVKARRAALPERVVRWCRRNRPQTLAMFLLAVIAIGSTAAALLLSEARRRSDQSLWESRLDRALTGARSRRGGQVLRSLEAIREAARIRPSLELRNAAIAAWALADFDLAGGKSWPGYPEGSTAIAIDHDLRRYARGDLHGTVRVAHVEGDVEIATFPGTGRRVIWLSFSPDGRHVCAHHGGLGDPVKDLSVWSLDDRRAVFSSPATTGDYGGFQFLPDSRSLVYAVQGQAHALRRRELASGDDLVMFQLESRVASVRLNPSASRVAVTLHNRRVQVWELEQPLKIFEQPGNSAAWHPGGRLIAVTHPDGTRITLWDIETGAELNTLAGHENGGARVLFDRTGNVLVSSGWDATVRLWNLCGLELCRVEASAPHLAFNASGDLFGHVQVSEQVSLWGYQDPSIAVCLPGQPIGGADLAFSADTRLLLDARRGGLAVWDMARDDLAGFLPIGTVATARILATRPELLTSGSRGIVRWTVAGRDLDGNGDLDEVTVGSPQRLALPGGGPAANAEKLAIDQAEARAVAQVSGHGTTVIDLRAWKVAHILRHHNSVWCDISSDGRWCATGALHGNDTRIWSTDTGEAVLVIPAREGSVVSARVMFLPEGGGLVLSFPDGFEVLEQESWRRVRRISRLDPGESPSAMAYGAGGKVLAVARSIRLVQVLDAASGEVLAALELPDSPPVSHMAFSRDAGRVAVRHGKSGVVVWNLARARAKLRALDLDWQGPGPEPEPATPARLARPLRVQVEPEPPR